MADQPAPLSPEVQSLLQTRASRQQHLAVRLARQNQTADHDKVTQQERRGLAEVEGRLTQLGIDLKAFDQAVADAAASASAVAVS